VEGHEVSSVKAFLDFIIEAVNDSIVVEEIGAIVLVVLVDLVFGIIFIVLRLEEVEGIS